MFLELGLDKGWRRLDFLEPVPGGTWRRLGPQVRRADEGAQGFGGGGAGGNGIQVAGDQTCSNCGRHWCWATRYSCYRCGPSRYFDG